MLSSIIQSGKSQGMQSMDSETQGRFLSLAFKLIPTRHRLSLVDDNLHNIFRTHRDNGYELTIVAAIRTFNIPYGTVETNDAGLLTSLREKPEISYFVNSGMYVMEPGLLDEIPSGRPTHMTDVISSVMDRGGRVGVFPVSEGSWMDIGEWKEWQKTQARLDGRPGDMLFNSSQAS